MEGTIEITLGGKPRTLQFSMWAIEEMERLRTEKAVQPHRLATALATHLIYVGLANHVRIEKDVNDVSEKELDFTWNDVNNWVYQLYDQEDGFETIAQINKCYQDCNAYKRLTKRDDDDSDDKKKSSNGMTSMLLPSEK